MSAELARTLALLDIQRRKLERANALLARHRAEQPESPR